MIDLAARAAYACCAARMSCRDDPERFGEELIAGCGEDAELYFAAVGVWELDSA